MVIQKQGQCLAALEIKLTALPDNSTCELDEAKYGSELVGRPDTIAYLACSIAESVDLSTEINFEIKQEDFTDAKLILPRIKEILSCLKRISNSAQAKQGPFLTQPIWKTVGKSSELSDNCLDVFVWSNAAFLQFITELANDDLSAPNISRRTRTAIWMFDMLQSIKTEQKFNHLSIIDLVTYNTKNDKAFASNGCVTNKYMTCPRLIKPAITNRRSKISFLAVGRAFKS